MPKTPVDEQPSWGEICQKVRFGDGLYQSCRNQLPSFTGFAGGAYDEEDEDDDSDYDIDKELRGSALPIPEPPSARSRKGKALSATAETSDARELGLLEQLIHGDAGKYILYAGMAAGAAWWFLFRAKDQVAVTDSPALPSPGFAPASTMNKVA